MVKQDDDLLIPGTESFLTVFKIKIVSQQMSGCYYFIPRTVSLSDQYNQSEPMVEFYHFPPCYPGFFGINCMFTCHCDQSCSCDPFVGCTDCDDSAGCDVLHKGFPKCQGREYIHNYRFSQLFF